MCHTTSAAAEEGTKAHEMAEELLNHGEYLGDCPEVMGKHVSAYVDYVRELVLSCNVSIARSLTYSPNSSNSSMLTSCTLMLSVNH
jgi:hypothetical protein